MQETTQSNIYLCLSTTQKLDNTILIHKSESQFNIFKFKDCTVQHLDRKTPDVYKLQARCTVNNLSATQLKENIQSIRQCQLVAQHHYSNPVKYSVECKLSVLMPGIKLVYKASKLSDSARDDSMDRMAILLKRTSHIVLRR